VKLPPAVAVVFCVLAWIAAYFTIDVLVQQSYPVPSDVAASANMVAIIASRPEAAVALNVFPILIVLALLAFIAARRTAGRSARHGMVVTGIVLVLWFTSACLTHNAHWTAVLAIALAAPVGVAAALRGGQASM